MKFVARIIVAIFALCVAAVAAEIALRTIGYHPELSSAWLLESEYRELDEQVISIEREYTSDAYYDAFRSPGNSKVVVALGDSFTIGVPVRRENSYPSVLERLLRDAAWDARVLSVGLGDSGPDQHLRLFTERVLPRVKPDIVIWQFYANDSLDNAIKPLFAISGADQLVELDARDNWMYRRQRFYDAAPLPSAIKRGSYLFHLLLRQYERDLYSEVPDGTQPVEWGRRKIALEVSRMNELAHEYGFEVYYVVVAPQAVYRSDNEANSAGELQALEYPNLVSLLKAQPNFVHVRFDPARERDLFADGDRDANVLGTRHFNETGYALFARTVAERLLGAPAPASEREAVVLPIRLDIGGNSARKSLRSGWYQDERMGDESYVWSEGAQSVLAVPLPEGRDVRMDIDCQPFLFPNSPAQRVTVVLNGAVVNEVVLKPQRQRYPVILPSANLREGDDVLEFRYAYARRPQDVKGEPDTRTLGVSWFGIDFAEAPR